MMRVSHPGPPNDDRRSPVSNQGSIRGDLVPAAIALLLAALLTSPLSGQANGPTIEKAWPQPATVGELVTLEVRGAGSKLEALTVRFGEQPAQILDLVGDQLLVRVPAVNDLTSVSVQRNRRHGPALPFQIRPTAQWVAAAGPTQATLQFVVVGSEAPQPVEVTSLDPDRPALIGIGSPTSSGTNAVISMTVGGSRNTGRVELAEPEREPPSLHLRPQPRATDFGCDPVQSPIPEIWEIVPFRAAPGEPVRLRGRGFGSPTEATLPDVNVGGEPATILQRGATEMIVLVPDAATTGEVEVERNGTVSNMLPMQVLPRLVLSADRLDLVKGQSATITARLVGTAKATELTVALLTPNVARLEGGRRSGTFSTAGGENNLVSFRVRAEREGRFELLVTAPADPAATAEIQSTPHTGPTDEPDGTHRSRLGPGVHSWSELDLSAWNWSGERSTRAADQLDWELVPPSLGTVSEQGLEIDQPTVDERPPCGVAIGRDPEQPDAAPVTIPISDPTDGVVFQQAPEDPPVAGRGGGCDWRKICIDVFVMAERQGDRYTLGHVLEPFREAMSGYRVREATVPATAFSRAGGALADVTEQPGAAQLVANVRSMLRRLSGVYAECCVWFEVGHVYAVDPSRARATDNVRLDSWVRGGEEPEMHVGRKIRDGQRELTFLDGARSFVENHSGLEENQCLKIFVGRGFTGSGDEAGLAEAPGEYATFDQGRLEPNASPFVAAHEIGHCLMDREHWERTDDQGARRFNCMEHQEPSVRHSDRDLFLDRETQCPKIQRRAREIGVAEAPPRPAAAPESPAPTDPETADPEAEDPGPGPSDASEPSDEAPAPPTPPEEDEQENCPCPDPELSVTGLDGVNELRDGRSATVVATFETCCATVRLSAEIERVRIGTYNVIWTLQIEKTNDECFIDFTLDRYFNSKSLPFLIGGGAAGQAVQVRSAELRSLGGNRFELRGDGGYQLDYAPFGGTLNDRNLDSNGDTTLNQLERVRSWLVLLGGVVRCRNGEETVAFPFHFRLEKSGRDEIEVEASRGVLERDDAPRSARRRMVTGTVSRLP